MNERVKKLAEEISKLPSEEQAELMDELLVLTCRPDPEIDRAWAREARDRLDAWRRGELKSRPVADALAKHIKP
jgi:hypothetical protein